MEDLSDVSHNIMWQNDYNAWHIDGMEIIQGHKVLLIENKILHANVKQMIHNWTMKTLLLPVSIQNDN